MGSWLPSLLPPAIFHAATRVVWLKCISDRSGSSSAQNIPWLPISSRGKLPTPFGIPGPGRSLMLRSPSALEPALCSKRSHRSEKPGSSHPTITTYHSLPGWFCSSLTLLLCSSNHPDIRRYRGAFALAVPTPSSYDSFIPQVSASVATSQWDLSDPWHSSVRIHFDWGKISIMKFTIWKSLVNLLQYCFCFMFSFLASRHVGS